MAEEKARLWRPLAVCGVFFALWLARQPLQRIENRWPFYAIVGSVLAACAVTVWGVQRLLRRRWPVPLEVVAVFGLLIGVSALGKYVFFALPARDEAVGYQLDDAEARNREAPDTFPIPPAEARQNLKPGQYAKLLFVLPVDGEEQVERMWVRVTGRDGDAYVGELSNQPASSDRLRPGARVRFEPRHVIAIRMPEEQN